MKVAIIVGNNVWFCPYIKIYTTVFEKNGIDYDIISWNRDAIEEDAIQFTCAMKHKNPLAKFWASLRYSSFVKDTLSRNDYDGVVIFSIATAIFLNRFLSGSYGKRYIFDYRDLSIEQKTLFKKPFLRVLKNSFANVVSSPGFVKYLPKGFDYVLSHNFDINVVRKALDCEAQTQSTQETIDVLTIGGIRDYESNSQVIDALANKEGFTVRFVGKGPSAEALKQYAEERQAKNVTFEGYYPKEKEKEYIESCTFLNIFYPRKLSHDTAISNRFYNSLIYHKPMITTADTVQGDYAARYGVGLSLENCENLDVKLKEYLQSDEYKNFSENAHDLLYQFVQDYEKWESVVNKFAVQSAYLTDKQIDNGGGYELGLIFGRILCDNSCKAFSYNGWRLAA